MFLKELKILCNSLKGVIPNDSAYRLEESEGVFRLLNVAKNWSLLFKFDDSTEKLVCFKLKDENEALFVKDNNFYNEVSNFIENFLISVSGKEEVLNRAMFKLDFNDSNVKVVGSKFTGYSIEAL